MFGQQTIGQGRLVNGQLVKHLSNEEINVRHGETY